HGTARSPATAAWMWERGSYQVLLAHWGNKGLFDPPAKFGERPLLKETIAKRKVEMNAEEAVQVQDHPALAFDACVQVSDQIVVCQCGRQDVSKLSSLWIPLVGLDIHEGLSFRHANGGSANSGIIRCSWPIIIRVPRAEL